MKTSPLTSLPAALLVCAALTFAGCGDKAPAPGANGGEHAHDHSAQHGGQLVESSDHSAHFEIVRDAKEGVVMLYLYDGKMKSAETDAAPVLNVMANGESVRIAGSGKAPSSEWAFVHDALKGDAAGRFRVTLGGKTYTPTYDPHGDHGHAHDGDHDHGDVHAAHGPHDGTVAAFEGGFVELKLHDDKGDLELWIAKDEAITQPYDLPLDATITVTFVDRGDKQVTLRVRNKDQNEDEDGKPTIRNGKTNYFIFPGDTGADASWLMGADFSCDVTVAFEAGGTRRATDTFLLRPHTHGAHGHAHDDGHEHDHDDHGHAHDGDEDHAGCVHGPHDGIVAAFEGGYVELKLHDDKGDLELWIAKDEGITQPYDLPLDARITVTFVDRGNKQVTLRVRNKDENEDEDGKPTIRAGKTNYFIFPGDTGADASWLMGADFSCDVTVAFEAGGKKRATKAFALHPHTHGGHGHEHK